MVDDPSPAGFQTKELETYTNFRFLPLSVCPGSDSAIISN